MKTLVIHPFDFSTDFLSVIYKGKDWTIIRALISKSKLKKEIKAHDRIIMLGHGTSFGLLNPEALKQNNVFYIIDSTFVYLLRQKQCVFVWCSAHDFVNKYQLKGFYTGMIVSEWDEANMFCIQARGNEITESNILFAEAVKTAILSENMVTAALDIYKDEINPVIHFNRENIFCNIP